MPRLKAEQRKEQLIRVAVQVFAHGGYNGTTTAEIARAAGVTEPILYRHFKNKQELFVAIVHSVSRSTVEHFQELIDGETDPIRRVRKVCASIPDHIRRHSDEYHVLHGALTTSRDRRVTDVIKEHYANMHNFFRQLVKQGQDARVFRRTMDPRRAAWHLIMTGVGYATLSLNLDLIDRATIGETIEEALRGMKE